MTVTLSRRAQRQGPLTAHDVRTATVVDPDVHVGGRIEAPPMRHVLAFLPLLVASPAIAKYAPPSFLTLATSDLVVLGKVVALTDVTFTLEIEEVLRGVAPGKTVVVKRFVNWTCAHRWKPYAVGQREVAFLQLLESGTPAPYRTRSAGDEGEWEVVGDKVASLGFRIPGYAEHGASEHPGQLLDLEEVLDALRNLRPCLDRGAPTWCSEEARDAYKKRSAIAEYLANEADEAWGPVQVDQ